jgi:hypothetical protein
VHEDAREMEDANVENRPARPPPLETVSPPDTALSPLAKQISKTSDVTTASSHPLTLSPFETSRPTSRTSHVELNNAPRKYTSIVDANLPPSRPIPRSDTWWARFANTSFLDRRLSDAGKSHSKPLDFRDPNPPPRFTAIKEVSGNSDSPESHSNLEDSNVSRRGSHHKMYSTAAHGRSVSSMQTAKTADSELIERMGGMDVQRVGTDESLQTVSTTSGSSLAPDSPPMIPSTVQYLDRDNATVESPTEMARSEVPIPQSDRLTTPGVGLPIKQTPMSEGAVSSRVKAYERRISQDMEGMSSPGSPLSPDVRNTRRWEERPAKKNLINVNYGLAPRPSLYVANPDNSLRPSSSSEN